MSGYPRMYGADSVACTSEEQFVRDYGSLLDMEIS